MSLLKIARLGNPVIRGIAKFVTKEELVQQATQELIDNMIDTMRDANGVGIAAPQVHQLKKIIAVEISPDNPRYPGQNDVPLTVIINPLVISRSEELHEDWEGCLSIPDMRALVPRSGMVKVSGLSRHGHPLEIEASGFFARVLLHETDHLEGIVFPDRLADLNTLTHLREYEQFWKKNHE